jgi:hypothetical protein
MTFITNESCRKVDDTFNMVNDWYFEHTFTYPIPCPTYNVFMSFFAIKDEVANMQMELEGFFFDTPEATSFNFEKETFLYAANFKSTRCLEFAFENSEYHVYKKIYGIVPLCLYNNDHASLRVALEYVDIRSVLYARFSQVHAFFRRMYSDVSTWNMKAMQAYSKTFQLIRSAIKKENMVPFYLKNHSRIYAKRILWSLFRHYTKFWCTVNYWIKITGENTCKKNGPGRKRHLNEFLDDFTHHHPAP